MNSEIYGHKTEVAWGFVFAQNGDTWASHPTQIYEALAYFLVFAVLLVLYNKNWQKKLHGMYIGLFLILVFVFRFFIEYVKEVQVAFEKTMTLNMGQILSIPFILAGVALLWYSLRKKIPVLHRNREVRKINPLFQSLSLNVLRFCQMGYKAAEMQVRFLILFQFHKAEK